MCSGLVIDSSARRVLTPAAETKLDGLSEKQKKFLRRLAHDRRPVVMLGNNGFTPAVLAEIDSALDFHELVKIKIAGADREERERIVSRIATSSDAILVQRIGHMAVLYRKHPKKPRIQLPA